MRKLLLLLCLLTSYSISYAQIELPSIIGDNMVLQRNSKAKIWGKTQKNKPVEVSVSWNNKKYKTTAKEDGKWEVLVDTQEAGGPYTITIKSNKDSKTLTNILLGDVWVCSGQSNMEMPVKGLMGQPVKNSLDAIIESESFPQIHMYTAKQVPALSPQDDVPGEWAQASIETTGDFSAVGYFYAKALHQVTKIPIGMVHFSWGGASIETWMSKNALNKYEHVDLDNIEIHPSVPQQIPTLLYNGMLMPLTNFTVKGFIWYQGETNIPNYHQYTSLFSDLVYEWRALFNGGEEMPFYYVQIAPFQYDGPDKRESAFLREAQLKCLDVVPNTGMAVTMDKGELECIHPSEKEIVGKRLAYQALAKTYGYESFSCDGPLVDNVEEKEGKLLVRFKNADLGLYPMFKNLEGFELAGENKEFYPAKAVVPNFGNVLEVSSDDVPSPKYVRYGFRNYLTGSLYNGEGLPASSFRTDF